MDIIEFAAARNRRLTSADDDMRSLVVKAMSTSPLVWDDVVEGASVLWLEIFQGEAPKAFFEKVMKDFQDELAAHLEMTSKPDIPPSDVQTDRVTLWIGTFVVNNATFHATRATGERTMRWVSMHDAAVRHTHQETDGQVVSVNGTFDVGGFQLHYPGEPIGPAEIWINCRCLLASGKVKAMTAAATTTATAPIDEVDPEEVAPTDEVDDPNVELVDDVTEIPVHGVATIEGKPTGDGRMFAAGALSNRDLPLPMRFEFVGTHGGETSDVATIGTIDEMWMQGSEMRYRGTVQMNSQWGPETVAGIIDGRYKGISVEIDDVTLDVTEERNAMKERIKTAQQNPGDTVEPTVDPTNMSDQEIEQFLDDIIGDGTMPLTTFSAARVCGFTIVPIGAYAEAYIALGSEFPDELSDTAKAAIAACGCGEPSADDIEEANADYTAAVAALVAAGSYAPGTHDGPGWITHPKATARIRRYWVRGKGAAKIRWGTPGDFNRCRKQLAKYVQNPDWLAGLCANMHKEAIGMWPGQEDGGRKHAIDAVTAAAFSVADTPAIPASFFANPNLTAPTGVTIEDDGHVYGHIATWSVCHIGIDRLCRTAPHSATNYSLFATGFVKTDDGQMARVGQITMGTGHADMSDTGRAAAYHYDNTGSAVADIAVGEDGIGIWFSGKMRETATPEQVHALRASGRLSGDWRPNGAGLELVGALAVNVPGFPIPVESLAASGGYQTALVAAGIVPVEEAIVAAGLDTDTIVAIARTAVADYRHQEKVAATVAPIREKVRERRMAAARARFTKE